MKKTKQFTLFPNQTKKIFGGALLYKKRKSKRPLSKKDSIQLVLRSEWAMGSDSFLAKRIYQVIEGQIASHTMNQQSFKVFALVRLRTPLQESCGRWVKYFAGNEFCSPNPGRVLAVSAIF